MLNYCSRILPLFLLDDFKTTGITYKGVLASLDGFLNIAMEQTSEYGLDGELFATYGDCFIRGNNVLYISPQKKK